MGAEGTAAEIAGRLAATALVGSPLTEVALPAGEGTTWVVDLPDGDLTALWEQARDALAGLGLYPVAVTTWAASDWADEDLFSRFYYGENSAPAAVIGGSRALSVEEALDRFARPSPWASDHWGEIVDFHVGLTERYYGEAPDRTVLTSVPVGDELALERRLLAWEEDLRPTTPPEINAALDWYEADRVGLALVPVALPCHAAAYLSFYGADGEGRHEALTRLMCAWQTDFGARLVANWGTMLQFVVSTPPTTLDDAFMLATQHVSVAPCTTALPGEGIRQLARHLWQGKRWFLHERP